MHTALKTLIAVSRHGASIAASAQPFARLDTSAIRAQRV